MPQHVTHAGQDIEVDDARGAGDTDDAAHD
jgi:hypothetical protein